MLDDLCPVCLKPLTAKPTTDARWQSRDPATGTYERSDDIGPVHTACLNRKASDGSSWVPA